MCLKVAGLVIPVAGRENDLQIYPADSFMILLYMTETSVQVKTTALGKMQDGKVS